jgi:hypothetical protein
MKSIFASVIITALACACVHSEETRISDNQLATVQDGKTTVGEAVGALGPPTSDVWDSSGQRVLGYSYRRAETSRTRHVLLIFDKDGLLVHHTVTDSQF